MFYLEPVLPGYLTRAFEPILQLCRIWKNTRGLLTVDLMSFIKPLTLSKSQCVMALWYQMHLGPFRVARAHLKICIPDLNMSALPILL